MNILTLSSDNYNFVSSHKFKRTFGRLFFIFFTYTHIYIAYIYKIKIIIIIIIFKPVHFAKKSCWTGDVLLCNVKSFDIHCSLCGMDM